MLQFTKELVNGAPFVNGVAQAPMPRELADSDPSIDQRRYWPTVRNSAVSLKRNSVPDSDSVLDGDNVLKVHNVLKGENVLEGHSVLEDDNVLAGDNILEGNNVEKLHSALVDLHTAIPVFS
jgi:hypothetical protein